MGAKHVWREHLLRVLWLAVEEVRWRTCSIVRIGRGEAAVHRVRVVRMGCHVVLIHGCLILRRGEVLWSFERVASLRRAVRLPALALTRQMRLMIRLSFF